MKPLRTAAVLTTVTIAAAWSAMPARAQPQPPPQAPAATPAPPPTAAEPDRRRPDRRERHRRGPRQTETETPPGLALGPALMTPGMMAQFCHPQTAGLTQWRVERLAQSLSLTEAQIKQLDEIKSASAKALEIMQKACPRDPPVTPTGRLELMEKRLAAMLDAVKTVRGAFDAFYASLNDEQKARLALEVPGRERR